MGKTNITTQSTSGLNKDDIRSVVAAASKVIVPLSPISVFAARNPWSGLEHKTFDEIAHWLEQVREVDIYPAITTIIEAHEQGEIDDSIIEKRLQKWLDQTTLVLPRESDEKYARNALKLRTLKSNKDVQSQVEACVSHIDTVDISSENTYSVPLLSTRIVDDKNKKLIDTVDYHVIKWCKLYIDDAQSGWTMPNRDKGLFYAWRRLVQYDPALPKQQRALLKTLPNNSEALIEATLLKLGIAESDMES